MPQSLLVVLSGLGLQHLIFRRSRNDSPVLRIGHHPVAHKAPTRANLSDQDWLDYWAGYYRKSRQLGKADEKSWKATREVWMRKLVQAKRVRCPECTRIVKLWLKNYGYGPKRFLLQEAPGKSSTVKRS
jgi:hypothetical protein